MLMLSDCWHLLVSPEEMERLRYWLAVAVVVMIVMFS
jgi:hypothetical protein